MIMQENIITIRKCDSSLANEAFADFMKKTESELNDRANKDSKFFKSLNSSQLEVVSVNCIKDIAPSTPFRPEEIKLVAGTSFPDIVAETYYGIEVKSTKSNHWKSTGSSIMETTRNKNIENINLLNDTYLFEIASEQTLKLAYPESSNANIEEPSLPGVRGFFAKWFGILFKKEKDYEEKMHQVQLYEAIEDVVQGRQYPRRLFPIKEENRSALFSRLNPLRDYTIWSLILMFFIFSGIGWIWEVSLHLITDGVFVNRGALHGPWLPIYGSGGILILVLLKRFRNKPMLNFFLILLVCGILEYTTSYVMEMNTGLKWWDYSGYFLNLNGRICAEGLSVFGIGGMAFVYILAPVFDNLIEKIKPIVAKILCIVLLIVFSFDAVYSHFYPNTGEGITDYQ